MGALIRWSIAAAAIAATGCASYASRAVARPAAPGETIVAVAADVVVFEHGRRYTAVPAPELSIRRGMGDRWDLGARVGAGSAELGATIAVARWARSALAVVPHGGLGFAPVTNNGTDVLRAHAGGRLVWERDVADRVALAASVSCRLTGAAPVTLFGGDAGEARILFEPGASLGLRVRVGSRVVWPELGVMVPIDPGAGAERPAIQGGIALEL